MVGRAVLFISIVTLLVTQGFQASCGQDETREIIQILDEQIESSTSAEERAKFCCFRARNYLKLKDIEQAEQDYLEALDTAYTGWILNEYTQFLYRNGEYERAFRAAHQLNEDFPQFKDSALKLKEQSRQKYQEEYQAANPPTIIMDSAPDPNRVTRHDLLRQYRSPKLYRTDLKKSSSASKSKSKSKAKSTQKKTKKKAKPKKRA